MGTSREGPGSYIPKQEIGQRRTDSNNVNKCLKNVPPREECAGAEGKFRNLVLAHKGLDWGTCITRVGFRGFICIALTLWFICTVWDFLHPVTCCS